MFHFPPEAVEPEYAVNDKGLPDAFELNSFLIPNRPAAEAVIRRFVEHAQHEAGWDRLTQPRRDMVAVIVANLVCAHHRGPGKAVKYYRTPRGYCGRSVYRDDALSARVLAEVVDALTEANLIGSKVGYHGPQGRGSVLSIFWAKPRALEIFGDLGLEASSFIESAEQSVVVLKGRKHQLVEYDPTHRMFVPLISLLRAYNAQIARHELNLTQEPKAPPGHPQGDWDGYWEQAKRIDLSATSLHRSYSNVRPKDLNLDQGGRFYGPWWQNMPSELRPFTTIDGERTVELDYATHHPRILYGREGLELEGDAYCVPALQDLCDDMAPKALRDATKGLFNAMLNGNRKKIHDRLDDNRDAVLKRWDINLSEKVSIREALRMIEEHHQPIAHHFRTSIGLKLQNQDADICADILAAAIEAEIPILPVHDSFICRERDERWLLDRMEVGYANSMGGLKAVIRSKSLKQSSIRF